MTRTIAAAAFVVLTATGLVSAVVIQQRHESKQPAKAAPAPVVAQAAKIVPAQVQSEQPPPPPPPGTAANLRVTITLMAVSPPEGAPAFSGSVVNVAWNGFYWEGSLGQLYVAVQKDADGSGMWQIRADYYPRAVALGLTYALCGTSKSWPAVGGAYPGVISPLNIPSKSLDIIYQATVGP